MTAKTDLADLAKAFLAFARWRAGPAIALIAGGALVEGIGLVLLIPALQTAFRPDHPLWAALGLATTTSRIAALLLAFAMLMVARNLVLAARDRLINHLQFGYAEAVRVQLATSLAGAEWQRVSQFEHARIVQAMSMEIHQVGIVTNSMLSGAVALILLAANAMLALVIAPLAGGLTLLAALAGYLLVRPMLHRARALGEAITRRHFDMTANALVFLAGLKVAAAQGTTDTYIAQQREASAAAVADRLAFATAHARARDVSTGLVSIVAITATIACAASGVAPARLITLLIVLARMSAPVTAMQQAAQQMLHSLPAYAALRMLERELAEPAKAHRPVFSRPVTCEDGIVLDNICFDRNDAVVLRDVSLHIAPGEFLGIIGPSGAGKTTLLDLIAGLMPPSAGAVMSNGRPLHGDALIAHRHRLAYVGQDPFLFDGTLRRNLDWGCGGCEDGRMIAVLTLVGALPLTRRLGGLDARLGDRGALVSAGERQRLAIARAVLRRPRLLLLDEATNALDIENERQVLEALAALAPRPTIVMVSHRGESLLWCDRIVRVSDNAPIPAIPDHARIG